MKSLYAKLERVVHPLEEVGIFLVFSALVIVMMAQVFSRFVLGTPMDTSEELSRLCMIWLVFLGAARALRTCEHFLVDALVNTFPARPARILSILIDILTVGFVVTLLWISYSTSMVGARQMLPALGISVIWQTMALPVGMALMLFHSVGFILRNRAIGIPLPDSFIDEHGHAHKLPGIDE